MHKFKKKPIIITTNNFKGGSTRTNLVQNISASLTLRGYKVLCVDLDPQINLSSISCSIEKQNETELTIYDLLVDFEDKLDPHKAVIKTEMYDLLLGDGNINMFEEQYRTKIKSDERLKEVLARFGDFYDFIFLDSNSGNGIIINNCLCAAHEIIIPVEPDMPAVMSLQKMYNAVQEVQKYYPIKILAVIVSKYDGRTNLSQDVINLLFNTYGDLVVRVPVPTTVNFQTARRYLCSIFQLDKNCLGARSIEAITEELLLRLKNREESEQ